MGISTHNTLFRVMIEKCSSNCGGNLDDDKTNGGNDLAC